MAPATPRATDSLITATALRRDATALRPDATALRPDARGFARMQQRCTSTDRSRLSVTPTQTSGGTMHAHSTVTEVESTIAALSGSKGESKQARTANKGDSRSITEVADEFSARSCDPPTSLHEKRAYGSEIL
jgi:hypothetical protein